MKYAMSAKSFSRLSKRDFDNGAITDDIHNALKHREELIEACGAAIQAMADEFLYQTGQFCRPAQQYPPQGSVHAPLMDAATALRDLLGKYGPS